MNKKSRNKRSPAALAYIRGMKYAMSLICIYCRDEIPISSLSRDVHINCMICKARQIREALNEK